MVKASEIRSQKAEELNKQLADAARNMLELRFKLETKQLVNHREIRRVKRISPV